LPLAEKRKDLEIDEGLEEHHRASSISPAMMMQKVHVEEYQNRPAFLDHLDMVLGNETLTADQLELGKKELSMEIGKTVVGDNNLIVRLELTPWPGSAAWGHSMCQQQLANVGSTAKIGNRKAEPLSLPGN